MSRDKITTDLVRIQTRALKMPGAARQFEDIARQARAESWSFEEFLQEVLCAEVASRNDSAVRARLAAARFPEIKTLDTFDFALASGVEPQTLRDLARGAWVEQGDNLIFAGPIGTGKTHLAIALGVEAARARKHVAFYRAADLVRVLLEARDQRELGRLQRRMLKVDLVILDELGFVPFAREGGELLFHLLAHRYERRRAVLVTTNLAFAEWPTIFAGDEKLTTALLDRLAEHATVVTTRGKSYRMRNRQPASEPGPA